MLVRGGKIPEGVNAILQSASKDNVKAFMRRPYISRFDLTGDEYYKPSPVVIRMRRRGEIVPWTIWEAHEVKECWCDGTEQWFSGGPEHGNMDMCSCIAMPKEFLATSLYAFVWMEGSSFPQKRRAMNGMLAHAHLDLDVCDKRYASAPLRMIGNAPLRLRLPLLLGQSYATRKQIREDIRSAAIRKYPLDLHIPPLLAFRVTLRAPWTWWHEKPMRMPSGVWMMVCMDGLIRRPMQ